VTCVPTAIVAGRGHAAGMEEPQRGTTFAVLGPAFGLFAPPAALLRSPRAIGSCSDYNNADVAPLKTLPEK